jgi:2'-5' RNA ligase
MPEGAARESVAALVQGLADRLQTTPFVPHVTLLPGLDGSVEGVLEGARVLAAGLGPIDVQPVGVDGSAQHFRCLFFRMAGSPALREAHARAALGFGRSPDPAFDPHLSLVYGSLDAAERAELTRRLGPRLPGPFVTRRLHVWRTHGTVGEWRELAAFPLGGGV